MRRLTTWGTRRPMDRWDARRDDGAVIVLVALLVAAGVISGLLALVADMGQLYSERRVVQNGADAAALALTQECADGTDGCPPPADAQAHAGYFANVNSPDQVSAVTEVCGTDGLPACPAPGSHWADCQPVSGDIDHYVRVRTATMRPDGESFLLPIFAGLLADSADSELGTAACAQAAWGPAQSAPLQFPVLLPVCPGGPDGVPVVTEDFDPNDPVVTPDEPCVVDGVTYPGVTKGFAFGEFPGVPKTCIDPVTLSVGDVIPVETSVTQWCGTKVENTLDGLIAAGEPVLVPVVGDHANQGQGQYDFTILSFKSFTLLGYKIKNASGGQAPNGVDWSGTACEKSAKRSCLYGSFGPATVPGDIGGGPDLGVRAVTLVP